MCERERVKESLIVYILYRVITMLLCFINVYVCCDVVMVTGGYNTV